MNFKQLLAKYVSGNLCLNEIPKVTYIAFEEGYDSPSLWILAGLNENDNDFEIEHYLKLSLEEMSLVLPSKRKAALKYGSALAEEIIDDKRELITGVCEIYTEAFRNCDFRMEDKNYVYDGIFFHHVYGVYYTYDDLDCAIVSWNKDKSNQELMLEVKESLMNELKKWNEIIKPYLETIL